MAQAEKLKRLDTAEIAARSADAWRIKDLWVSTLTEAYELVMPWWNPYSQDKKAPKTSVRQFDSTASHSAIRAANRLLMELTPPDQKWFAIQAGPLVKLQASEAQVEELNKKLELVVSLLAMVFWSGTFQTAMWKVWLDVIIAGMGCMLTLEDKNNPVEPAIFQNVSQAEVAIADGPHGVSEETYRKREIKVRMIKRLWQDAKMPQELLDMMKDPKQKEKEVSVLEATYPMDRNGKRVWFYDVLFCGKNSDPIRLVEREYTSNPWQIFRWCSLPGCPYGPGPVLQALADIRTVNKVMQMVLQNAALSLAGMYLVRDDGVVNPDTIMITSGGMIPVASTGGSAMGASIAPLQTGRDFAVKDIILNDMRDRIRKHLFDYNLPDPSQGVRSPTEISARLRQFTQDTGGNIGRLIADIVQLVRRVADIYTNLGITPPLKIDQFNLKVQVNSPLARAQKMQDVDTTVNWMQLQMGLGGPAAMMLSTKVEDAFARIGEDLGVSQDLIRTKDERKALQDNVVQFIAAAQMQQSAGQAPELQQAA